MSELIDAIELGEELVKKGYENNALKFSFDDMAILLDKNHASDKISLDESMKVYNAMRDAYYMGFGRGFNKGCDFGKYYPELIED